jgi:hypothetical protein
MTDDIDDDIPNIGIADVLRSLPLCDELYVGMQAMNLGVVDGFLEQEEARLVSEYMRDDAMPWPRFILVSALSEMWIFALYEFLRTWRQRSRDVVEWAKSFQGTPANERDARLAAKRQDISARAADPDEALAFPGRLTNMPRRTRDFLRQFRKRSIARNGSFDGSRFSASPWPSMRYKGYPEAVRWRQDIRASTP